MLTNHIGIKVKDVEKSIKFYCDNLGFMFEHKYEDKDKILVFIKNENAIIEFVYKKDAEYNSVNNGIIEHLAFTVDDIHQYINKLKNNNVKFLLDDMVTVDGKYIIFFEGPNGEKLELVQYI